jgi:hypothetical protein
VLYREPYSFGITYIFSANFDHLLIACHRSHGLRRYTRLPCYTAYISVMSALTVKCQFMIKAQPVVIIDSDCSVRYIHTSSWDLSHIHGAMYGASPGVQNAPHLATRIHLGSANSTVQLTRELSQHHTLLDKKIQTILQRSKPSCLMGCLGALISLSPQKQDVCKNFILCSMNETLLLEIRGSNNCTAFEGQVLQKVCSTSPPILLIKCANLQKNLLVAIPSVYNDLRHAAF